MRIICSTCKKVLGVQRPFDNNSEVPAKCPECFQKEKEEALKPQPKPGPGEQKEITLENGLEGFLTIAGVDSPKLSFWDLVVSGKVIFCAKDRRENFREYLEMIDKDAVNVTFLHSSTIKLDSMDGRRKKQPIKPDEKKPNSIDYNCTVTVSRDYALRMFDGVAERLQMFLEILAEAALKAEIADPKIKDKVIVEGMSAQK